MWGPALLQPGLPGAHSGAGHHPRPVMWPSEGVRPGHCRPGRVRKLWPRRNTLSVPHTPNLLLPEPMLGPYEPGPTSPISFMGTTGSPKAAGVPQGSVAVAIGDGPRRRKGHRLRLHLGSPVDLGVAGPSSLPPGRQGRRPRLLHSRSTGLSRPLPCSQGWVRVPPLQRAPPHQHLCLCQVCARALSSSPWGEPSLRPLPPHHPKRGAARCAPHRAQLSSPGLAARAWPMPPHRPPGPGPLLAPRPSLPPQYQEGLFLPGHRCSPPQPLPLPSTQ